MKKPDDRIEKCTDFNLFFSLEQLRQFRSCVAETIGNRRCRRCRRSGGDGCCGLLLRCSWARRRGDRSGILHLFFLFETNKKGAKRSLLRKAI